MAPDEPAESGRRLRFATAERFVAVWERTHRGDGALPGHPVYEDVVEHYGAPERAYHTLGHVDDCLARLDGVASLVANRDAIEIALWFHDVLCDAGARDNEIRSARYYLDRSVGATPRFRIAVCRMILASRHVQHAIRADASYMVDIDLAGFGDAWPQFRRSTDLVRAEFPHQSDREFAAGLAPFLRSLLARKAMFATGHFRDRCEAAARRNVTRLLTDWRELGHLGE